MEILLPTATPELLEQTRIQIEKDLGLTGFRYPPLFIASDLPSLVPLLADKLQSMKEQQTTDLMKIIYRVDLTEKQYKKVLAMHGEWSVNMAKAIVLREFQKVVIRKKFSE